MTVDRGPEPDLIFVANQHFDRVKNTYFDGPTDLVIEITSPESLARDRGDKFVEYEAAGIPEYWLIDPDRNGPEFYQLGTDGRYRPATIGPDGIYVSPALGGFRLQPAWLWADPLPDPVDALRSIGLTT